MSNLRLVNAILHIVENGRQSIGRSRGGLTTKIHMVSSSDRSALMFSLTPGNVHDAKAGRSLLDSLPCGYGVVPLVMDRACEGDEVRRMVSANGFIPVVPPRKSRRNPWDYDKALYKHRNEVERLFLRIKRFRRIFTRYDKLDVVYRGFILFAMIADVLTSVNTL